MSPDQSLSQALDSVAAKIAATEKATHFLEQRQDISQALPSDIRRRLQQYVSRMQETTTSEEKATTQADYSTYRADILQSIWRRSCLEGCLWFCRMPRRL